MASTGDTLPIRDPGLEDSDASKPIRMRSRVACRSCNHRKVRCDVTRTGIPCSNCLHETGNCEVLPRKKHRPRRSRATLHSLQPTAQYDPIKDGRVQDSRDMSHSAGQGSKHGKEAISTSHVENRASKSKSADSFTHPVAIEQRSSVLTFSPPISRNDKSNGTPLQIDPEEVLPDDSSLSYIGDRRGPRFFVYDLCQAAGSPQDATPYLNPRKSDILWNPHEVEYLRQQGAFTTFSDDVCDDMIRCYFRHVHFFLPVIDAASFLDEYNNNGRQNISLLLFWSMLLAAANFVPADFLKKSGFQSRKALKTEIYARAKCLYDLDRGTDKLVLIQSVILMSFWYTDPQDHTGAWYWIGIAISLSQTLGLHRSPQFNNRSQQLPDSQQPLIRRIWWSCLVRDRWISLAKGRPMRIHHEDCDLPLPRADDILDDLSSIRVKTREKFIPPEADTLSNMWIDLVQISSALGRILRIHYRVNGPKALAEDIHNSAEDLRYCRPREKYSSNASELLRLHGFHVELFYEATVAVLYRPYVLSGPSSQPCELELSVQKMALDKARSSASNTNGVLERMIELNMVGLLKPMMITTIIPAMQIHLFDCKSTEPLRRGLGTNKLNLCMLVLSQLRDTYWSASVTYRLFARAQALLDKSNANGSIQSDNQSESPHYARILPSIQAIRPEQDKRQEKPQQPQLQQPQPQPQQLPQQYSSMEETMRIIPESSMIMAEQVPAWMHESPYFTNVDQLLSADFTIPENSYQNFYGSYDNGLAINDQNMPGSGGMPTDLLYRG